MQEVRTRIRVAADRAITGTAPPDVPPGEHEVVFTYDGARVVWPLRLTLLGYALVVWLLWTGRRRTP